MPPYVTIGYHCSHEQTAPSLLLKHARRAGDAGFTTAMWSDHRHPWSERQGHSASRGVRLLLPSAGLCFLEVREVRCENPRHFELHRTSRSVGHREDDIQPSDADVVGEPNVDRALGKVLGVHFLITACPVPLPPGWVISG